MWPFTRGHRWHELKNQDPVTKMKGKNTGWRGGHHQPMPRSARLSGSPTTAQPVSYLNVEPPALSTVLLAD